MGPIANPEGITHPPIEAHPDDRLDVLDIPVGRARIELSNLRPVGGLAHRAGCAGPMAIGLHHRVFDAAPRGHRIAAGRSDLEEIRAVAFVETERRLRETCWRAIDRREMTPHRVRHPIDGLAAEGGQEALASSHLLHR